MRIYRTKRIRREWTGADRETAVRLLSDGASNDEIAAALGRNPAAVRAWLHHFCRGWQEPEVISYRQEVVAYDDVPSWYALGWRYVGPGEGGHVFEWRSSGTARIPNSDTDAASSLELAA